MNKMSLNVIYGHKFDLNVEHYTLGRYMLGRCLQFVMGWAVD